MQTSDHCGTVVHSTRTYSVTALQPSRYQELTGASTKGSEHSLPALAGLSGSYIMRKHVQRPVKKDRDHLARAHVKLWRRLLQLPDSVAAATVLRELRVLPPEHVWLRSTCRFRNAQALRHGDCLWRAVALSDWDDAIARKVKNWAWSVYKRLNDLGYPVHVDRRRLAVLSIDTVMRLHTARERACWQQCDVCPRTGPSEGATLCKCLRWFSLPDSVRANPYFRLRLGLRRVLQVVRFRLGCSHAPLCCATESGGPPRRAGLPVLRPGRCRGRIPRRV